jgi:hypothetical protein
VTTFVPNIGVSQKNILQAVLSTLIEEKGRWLSKHDGVI